MDSMIDNFKKGWLDEDPRLVTAVLLAIAVFIILSILLGKHNKKLTKLKDEAVKNGYTVKAVIKKRYLSHQNDKLPYSGWYVYSVNGETKEYSVKSHSPLPDSILLYPKNKSMTKFFSDYDRTSNAAIPLNAVVAVAVCIFTLWITGYFSL